MRRFLLLIATMSLVLAGSAAPASAGTRPTIQITPNPVISGGSGTITNAPNEASRCQGGGTLGGARVDIHLYSLVGPPNLFASAVPDADGNWQYVTPTLFDGTYYVDATCNDNRAGDGPAEVVATFEYERFGFYVEDRGPTEPPPTETPPPVSPPLVVADPVPLPPAFTG